VPAFEAAYVAFQDSCTEDCGDTEGDPVSASDALASVIAGLEATAVEAETCRVAGDSAAAMFRNSELTPMRRSLLQADTCPLACPTCPVQSYFCDATVVSDVCTVIVATVVAGLAAETAPVSATPWGAGLLTAVGIFIQKECVAEADPLCNSLTASCSACEQQTAVCNGFCCCASELPDSCPGDCCCCPLDEVPRGPSCACVPG
jgi:hypothetical protein